MAWNFKVGLHCFIAAVLWSHGVAAQRTFAQAPNAGTGRSPGVGSGYSAALQDAVEGIAGLMKRFEGLHPQLMRLPQMELQAISQESEQLHQRFLDLQQRMTTLENSGASPDAQLEDQLIVFHKTLALFVERISGRIGLAPPAGGAGLRPVGVGGYPSVGSIPKAPPQQPTFKPISFGSLGGKQAPVPPPRRSFGAPSTSDMDQRLNAAMQGIMTGMQRFEALHPKLRSLPPQVFQTISLRGQQLHEEFLVLQRRGVELSNQGNSADSEVTQTYVSQLESFVERQVAFIDDTEQKVDRGQGSAPGTPQITLGAFGGQRLDPGRKMFDSSRQPPQMSNFKMMSQGVPKAPSFESLARFGNAKLQTAVLPKLGSKMDAVCTQGSDAACAR